MHYVEYLAGLARALDPIPIMEVSELVAELRRRALPLPERGPWDTDPIYAGMCAEVLKNRPPFGVLNINLIHTFLYYLLLGNIHFSYLCFSYFSLLYIADREREDTTGLSTSFSHTLQYSKKSPLI